jgi:predicted dehydrogenase
VPRYASDDTLRIYRDEAGAPVTITPEVHVPGGEHPLVIAEFVNAIAGGNWDAHRGDFALHRTAVLDACYRSAAEGREIRLES